MAITKSKTLQKLRSAKIFLNENDEAIEKEVYININQIFTAGDRKAYLQKVHENIVLVLNLKNLNDSKYFDFEVFKDMVKEKMILKKNRIKKSQEKEQEPKTT